MNNYSQTLIKTAMFVFLILIPTISALLGLYLSLTGQAGWQQWRWLIISHIIVGTGITVGFHRMLVHQSFKPNPVVRFILLALGCMTLEGPPITWACVHLKHHVYSDLENDPHTPKDGFWHSHFGWLFKMTSDKIIAIKAEFGKIYEKDSMVLYFQKNYYFWVVLGLVIPYLIGGWEMFLWAGWIRVFTVSHTTWAVNSVCHTFGNRAFNTKEYSTNNFFVGLFGLGEGWHNNHHAFPRSASHGLKWWQIDISSYIILFLEKIGLVRDVQKVSQKDIDLKRNLSKAV